VRTRRGRARRPDGEKRARTGLGDRRAMARRVARIVDAHDAVAPAEQAYARRGAAANALQCGEPRFGIPELLVRRRRVDHAARVHPGLRIPATERLQETVAGMGVAID